jgi:hypothetical protein
MMQLQPLSGTKLIATAITSSHADPGGKPEDDGAGVCAAYNPLMR